MRLSHFEALQPVCPRCRWERELNSPLKLVNIISQDEDNIIEGLLHCSDPECRLEFPIIDGIPIIVRNVRQYISDNLFHITARNDLSDKIQSLLGDCAGPATVFDATRQHLSSYGWDHYGDLSPDNNNISKSTYEPGSIVSCLEKALTLVPHHTDGKIIDNGCSVGRTTFELAEKHQGLVLGVDVNFSMLRVAQKVLHDKMLHFPLRRIGIVYDEQSFTVNFKNRDRVDFWACDAMALPFSEQQFDLATAFNLLDSLNSPRDLLASIASVLKNGGHALLSTPYDWSALATPLETWIGGHSQRGPEHGAAEPLLRALLTPGAHPQSLNNLDMLAEISDFPWSIRVHDRSSTVYNVHIIAAQAIHS